jgi:hypothetical protein
MLAHRDGEHVRLVSRRGLDWGMAFSEDYRSSCIIDGELITCVFRDLGGKRIGLLHDLLPRATTIAVLATPAASREGTDAQEPARVLGLQIKVLIAGTDRELDAALASLAQMRPDALMVGTVRCFSPVPIRSPRRRSNSRLPPSTFDASSPWPAAL